MKNIHSCLPQLPRRRPKIPRRQLCPTLNLSSLVFPCQIMIIVEYPRTNKRGKVCIHTFTWKSLSHVHETFEGLLIYKVVPSLRTSFPKKFNPTIVFIIWTHLVMKRLIWQSLRYKIQDLIREWLALTCETRNISSMTLSKLVMQICLTLFPSIL